ncbi:MAG: hypothetical protein OEP95_08815 [Myxococcales bacterium]|nr:hypothetical protein [Myxococcales bacterium]
MSEAPVPSPGRTAGVIGPVVAGMLLDLVDLATFGPVGLYGGFVVGAGLGWWLAGQYGLSRRGRLFAAVAAAVYSATPATEWLPLGTLAGALLKWRRSGG